MKLNKECEMRFCMFMLSVSDRKVSSETRCGSYCFRGIMVIPVLIHKYRLYKCACFIIAQKIIRNSGDENQFNEGNLIGIEFHLLVVVKAAIKKQLSLFHGFIKGFVFLLPPCKSSNIYLSIFIVKQEFL